MLRRITYLFIALAFLVLMSLPIFAFVLAARGELKVGSEQGSNVRLFMVNSDEAEGIGIQRVRKVAYSDNCFHGSVDYLLWEGHAEDLSADYCSCVDERTGYMTDSDICDHE